MLASKKPPKPSRSSSSGKRGRGRRSGESIPAPAEEAEFLVVGIGASAGGLQALQQFFSRMPDDPGMAFVVVTHQDPTHTSLLPELIGKSTKLLTREIHSAMRVEPNCVYVTPPGKRVTILRGRLELLPPPPQHRPPLLIDGFLRSLSDDQKDRAVAVILSGTGSDGALGVQAVKGESGMTVAQEVESAQFGGMPESALATGDVDYVLPAEAIPQCLIDYAKGTRRRVLLETDASLSDTLSKVIVLLRQRHGHDFSRYKISTLARRVARRIDLHQLASVDDYVRYLREDPRELDLLFREILIKVTSFFRDADAFDALAQKGLPELLASRPEASTLRVWVPGCASGEEAYSIAILLVESIARLRNGLEIQVFGTDLDLLAIDGARTSRFPSGIASDVTPERLREFFAKDDSHYQVRRDIRDSMIFATHDVMKDPPFTRMDLISCRNLLIYLEADAQRELIHLFHYALNPGGLLLLGSSETIGTEQALFSAIDRRWKLYRRREGPSEARPFPTMMPSTPPHRRTIDRGTVPAEGLPGATRDLLASTFAPPSVIVDERGQIAHIHGRTGQYLEPAPGTATLNILEMAREGLRAPLSSAIRTAYHRAGSVVRKQVQVRTNGDFTSVEIVVRQIAEPARLRGMLMVSFGPPPDVAPAPRKPAKAAAAKPARGRVAEIERDLQETRRDLQHTIEEMQLANEELASANEEACSTNEELQSSNEELETSREELQSLNEELRTVNAEMETKMEDLRHLNDDMRNLLDSTSVATVFLDSQLNVRRFTEEARRLINLIPSDLGRPLGDLVTNLEYDRLVQDARQVLETLVPREVETRDGEGRWYLVRTLPYRTTVNVIDGLVLTFVDITAQKKAEQTALRAQTYAESIIETLRGPLLVLDAELHVVSANGAFYDTFMVAPEETEGQILYNLGGGQWDIPRLRELLDSVLPSDASFEDFEVRHDFAHIGRKVMLLNARCIRGKSGEPELILVAIEDVTERKERGDPGVQGS
jgi:two-component system CheB/CheR fusion protein